MEISDSTAGSVIHYTTDGTAPTSSSPITRERSRLASRQRSRLSRWWSNHRVLSHPQPDDTAAAAQAAAKLAFLQQPSNALTGAPITPAVTVAVEDTAGNTLPSATNIVQINLTGSSCARRNAADRRTERCRYLQQPHRWHRWKRVHVDRNEPRPNISDQHDIRNLYAHNCCAVGRYRNTGQRHTDTFADTNVHSRCRGNVERGCDLGANAGGGHDLSCRPLHRSCDGAISW